MSYAFSFFSDDFHLTWIIVKICLQYVYLSSLSCRKKPYVVFTQKHRHIANSRLTVNRDNDVVVKSIVTPFSPQYTSSL